MVGCGLWFIALFAYSFWLSARHQLDRHRWYLKAALWSLPLPWLAIELGWIVAEYGRQPWAIEGVLPTALGVSSVSAAQVATSLAGFVLFYTALAIVDAVLMLKYARKGPDGLGMMLGDDSFDLWYFGFGEHSSRIVRGLFAAVIGVFAYLAWQFFAVRRPALKLPEREELERARDVYREHGGGEFAHLSFMRDKHLFWSGDHHAVVAYGVVRDRLVALGSPCGPEAAIKRAILDFRQFADAQDRAPLFYEVLEPDLSLYHDLGFDLFKLGELATINLDEFTLAGKRWEDLRQAVNRSVKEQLAFELVEPPFDTVLMTELERVSDACARRHQRLDLVRILRRSRRDHLRLASGDDDIVLDADADAAELRRHALRVRRDVQAWLDRDDHDDQPGVHPHHGLAHRRSGRPLRGDPQLRAPSGRAVPRTARDARPRRPLARRAVAAAQERRGVPELDRDLRHLRRERQAHALRQRHFRHHRPQARRAGTALPGELRRPHRPAEPHPAERAHRACLESSEKHRTCLCACAGAASPAPSPRR